MLDVGSLLPFGTRRITSMKVEFGNSGTLALAFLPARSPKSVASHLLPRLPFFLTSRTSLAHFFRTSPPIVAQSIRHYGSFPKAATSRKSPKKICNRHLPAQGSISLLFQTVLSRNNGPMLLLEKPSHPYFLPIVECTNVGLPHPFGKLLQGEFRLLQASWGFSFSPAQVRRIIALIICIEFVIRNLWQRGQVRNPCNICPARFRRRLKLFRWEADGGSPRCAWKLSVWSRGGRGRPND